MNSSIDSSEGRKVLNELEHRKMLDEIAKDLICGLNDCSSSVDVGQLYMYYKAPIPDLLEVLSDVKGKCLWFVNYSPITGEPLVAEYDWWLFHIARVNRVNYVIYSDWTHSKLIQWDIDRIYVNGEWKLCVQVGSSIITVEAGSWKRWKKKLS